jgi:hypothetical protein
MLRKLRQVASFPLCAWVVHIIPRLGMAAWRRLQHLMRWAHAPAASVRVPESDATIHVEVHFEPEQERIAFILHCCT